MGDQSNIETLEARHEQKESAEKIAELEAKAQQYAEIVNGGQVPQTNEEIWRQAFEGQNEGDDQEALWTAFAEDMAKQGVVNEDEKETAAAVAEAAGMERRDSASAEEGESGVDNPTGERQRNQYQTVTEQVADAQLENQQSDIRGIVRDVAGTTAGGSETILRDAATAQPNIDQSKRATGTYDNSSEGVSSEEALNAANANMVQGAAMIVERDKAVNAAIRGETTATNAIGEARKRATEVSDSLHRLEEYTAQIKNQEVLTAVNRVIADVTQRLEETSSMLAAAEKVIQEREEDAKKAGELLSVRPESVPAESPETAEPAPAEKVEVTPDNIKELAKERSKREAEAAANETLAGQQIDKAA